MSWVRSDKALLHHPKTTHLKVLLKVEVDVVIGRLHRLWWWCLDYALDGNLTKQEGKVIEDACGIPLRQLIRAGFVDSRPYRRIHDWWDNQGNYLKLRFKDQPDIWMQIRDSYKNNLPMGKHQSVRKGTPNGKTVDVDLLDLHTSVTKRTDVDLTCARETAQDAPLPGAALALNDNGGIGSTEKPRNQFELDHLARKMTKEQQLMSKLREAGFLSGKK